MWIKNHGPWNCTSINKVSSSRMWIIKIDPWLCSWADKISISSVWIRLKFPGGPSPLNTSHSFTAHYYIPIQAQPRLQRKRDKINNSFRIGDCSQSLGRAAQGRREARVSPPSWSSELTTIVDNVASTNLSARRSKTSCSRFLVQP